MMEIIHHSLLSAGIRASGEQKSYTSLSQTENWTAASRSCKGGEIVKKRYLCAFVALAICVLLIGGFPLTAEAAAETAELFTLESTRNMGITVKYETEAPDVEFIAPNGDVYGDQAVAEGKMTKTDSGTALFFRIPDAEAGTWQIRYDKKGNANIEVGYAPYASALVIEQFAFEKATEDTLTVQFFVTHDEPVSYAYSIYAVVEENDVVEGRKLLEDGYAVANEQMEGTVYLNDLSTYSDYKLLLEVNTDEDGMSVYESAISDSGFDYNNPNSLPAPEGFYVEMETTKGSMLIRWEGTEAQWHDTLVAVFINEDNEPIYYNTFASDISSTEIALDMATVKKVRVDISYNDSYHGQSLVASRTIDMAVATAVSLKCKDVTAAAQAEVNYKLKDLTGGPFSAVLTVNGIAQELVLQGDNSFSVQLEAFQNTIDLLWQYDENTAFRIKQEIYSDRLAPTLKIPGVAEKILTDQPDYILSGVTDPGCTVTVNGTGTVVDSNGIFAEKLPLHSGENAFVVIAVGPNGNQTQQTVVVELVVQGVAEKTGWLVKVLKYIPLIISALFSVVVSIFIILSHKNYLKVYGEKGRKQAIFSTAIGSVVFLAVLSAMATLVFIALWFFMSRTINSVEFYETVVSSGVDEAYKMLQTRDKYMWGSIISAVCLAVNIGVSILLKALAKKPDIKKKHQSK
jgi:hypothetical protein